MLNRWETTSRIVESGLIVIVRADSPEQAVRIAEATLSGGASAIEITYTVPGATEVIKQLVDTYRGKDLIIGAGTVLDPETARMAILAGAQFIVGPNFNPDTVRMCNRYQIPVMPGVTTLNEAVRALEAGADILKFFPGSEFSPSVIKAIRGPLPYAPLMPTGGVNLDNVGEWIRNGSVAVGVGGSLTAGAKIGDYQGITSLTKQYVAKIRGTARVNSRSGMDGEFCFEVCETAAYLSGRCQLNALDEREAFSVNIKVRFPGGKRAYAECKGFTIETDQSEKHGGDGSAPSPFDLFLCSLATCMGVYALNFGEKHGLSSEDLTLDLKSDKDPESGLVRNIEVTVVVPEHTPAPVRNGLARAVGHCMVKRHLEQAPSFDILVK